MNEIKQAQIPLLEFDPTKEAVIEPSRIFPRKKIPEYCLLCFYQEIIDQLKNNDEIHQIDYVDTSVHGNWPVYEIDFQGKKLIPANPGIGGPFATLILEYLIATGCSKFVVLGSGGTLDPVLKVGQLVLIEKAIRDEGTSYHYIPFSREINVNPQTIHHLQQELNKRKVNFITAKTWTTDAMCRETIQKIALRTKEGAKTVEMEAASLIAVAQFRNVTMGFLIYCGDDVSGKVWNERMETYRTPIREQLFWLSLELCLTL
jgi:uridine phosphorylase